MPKPRHYRIWRQIRSIRRAGSLGLSTGQPATETLVGVVERHDNRSHDPQMATSSELSTHATTRATDSALGHVRGAGTGNVTINADGSMTAPVGSGVDSFFELTEVNEEDFTGATTFLVYVNAAGTALEFVDGDTLFDPLGTATDAIADHLLEADPHPDYLLQDEADLLYSWMGHLQTVTTGGTGLTTIAADRIIYTSSSNVFSAAPITAFGRSLIDDADAAAGRTTLGLVAGGSGDIWLLLAGGTMTGTLTVPYLRIVAAAGASPTVDFRDGDFSGNPYGTLFSPALDDDTIGRVSPFGAGGFVFSGFADGTTAVVPMTLSGYSSTTGTTVVPAVLFTGWKSNGANLRQAIAGTEIILQVQAGLNTSYDTFAAPLTVRAGGKTFLNAVANSKMTQGLTIGQGGFDDDIFALQSSDVAHGITDFADTSTYLSVAKLSATAGGAYIKGFTEDTLSVWFGCFVTNEDTAHSTAGVAAFVVNALKKSGTGITSLATNANLFAIRNNNSTKVIVDADGDTFQDGTGWTTYDAFDDLALLTDVEAAILNPFDALKDDWIGYLRYNRSILEKAGLVHYNEDGHHFVNNSGMIRLHNGALRQVAAGLTSIDARIARLEFLVQRLLS